MEKELTKYDKALADLEENVRFYISSPDKAGEALRFVKILRDFAEQVEEKVKHRAFEIMSDKDLFEIDTGEYLIKRIDPTSAREYKASSVIEALGMERAIAFLKVSTSKLEFYAKKARLTGDELNKMAVGAVEKHRKGYIAIREKQNDKRTNA